MSKLSYAEITVDIYKTTIDKSSNERYSGEYEVTPKAKEETVLETNGKLMTNNVTVKKVPIYKTANSQNGTTVYIARE